MKRYTSTLLFVCLAGVAWPLRAAAQTADVSKTTHIERPTRLLVANNTATPDGFANPKVAPGLVRWHASFAAACEAAQKSGKPVLLFQMMGKLDDQFC
jgi:hypothetical protein